MLAIVKAIRKWRPYLLGRPFTVKTDQKSLKFLMEQRITTPAQARWLPKLLGYDYVIEYKRGPENQGADALSRMVECNFLAVSLPHADWWKELQLEVLQDSFYDQLSTGTPTQLNHQLVKRDGVWFRNGKIFLSPNSPLLQAVIADGHSSSIGGHFGYHKTLAHIQSSFTWPALRNSVKEFLRSCDVCQRFKTDCLSPAGLLQPLAIPKHVWSDVSMDFIEGLPPSKGHTVIMVVVDRLTKYVHLVPLKHPFTAKTVAKVFITYIVKLHSVPTSIVSDRDKIFVSSFWQNLS